MVEHPLPEEKKRRRDRIAIAVALALSLILLGSCFALPYLLSSGEKKDARERDAAHGSESEEGRGELERFLLESEAYTDAQDVVEANYVDEVSEDDLLSAAARGIRRMAEAGAAEAKLVDRGITAMVDSLDDPHSSYMSEEEIAALDTQLSGRLSGIGVAMEPAKNEIRVVKVLAGTPAEEAGLQEGDIVREVDGRDVKGMDLEKVVSMIRGPEGTTVQVGIVRPPSSEIKRFDIVRRQIDVPVVEVEMKQGKVGYLRITDWTEGVDERISRALAELRDKGAVSLVIDLRSNPGGYLLPAVSAADMFLRGGLIVSSRGRVAGTVAEYEADGEVEWDLPVVILLNRGSASSSEIFAAALRENERAVLVGETSFGKGSIQKIYRQDDGSGVRLTIARYYTPSGASIDDEGITPDVPVKNPVVGDEDLQLDKAVELAQGKV